MEHLELTSQQFEKQVADALKHLWDFSYLGMHPLAQMNCVKSRPRSRGQVSHVDVGRVVSDVLRAAIEKLKPVSGQRTLSSEKYYYAILTKAYIEGVDKKTIADSMNIGERTLYRYSIKAVQVVTQVLRDWEQSSPP